MEEIAQANKEEMQNECESALRELKEALGYLSENASSENQEKMYLKAAMSHIIEAIKSIQLFDKSGATKIADTYPWLELLTVCLVKLKEFS